MEYLVAIERGDKGHAFGVVVPDLPGCFSAGDTFEEALANAREAIELHLEAMMDAGEAPPQPTASEEFVGDPQYAGWIWALVDINSELLDDTNERINISMPRRVLHVIDAAAASERKTRSRFLAEAGLMLAGRRKAATTE